MIVITTNELKGMEIIKVIGLVQANSVRARHIGRDIMAAIRNAIGGEIKEYTKLMAESREQAVERLKTVAEEKGGNAVIGLRFVTSTIQSGASEILAYGTAVIIQDK